MSTVTVVKVTNDQLTQEFEGTFREHAQMIYRTAYSVTRSPHDAEDVLQTLFLGLLRRGVPEGAKQNLRAYLYRATVNLSINAAKKRARHVSMADSTSERLSSNDADTAGHDPDLERRLAEAMTKLKPRDVEMLVLRYEHDYSDAQIAKLLGKSRSAVAVTLYRARTHLKRLLSDSSSGKKS
jgi:RNA polymerase sigma-70 factor, ECF subfamily